MKVAALLLIWLSTPGAAAISYYQEGLKLMRAERYQEAVVAFEKEASENPGSAEVLMNLGWSYWKVNRIDDAWRCFDLLAKLDPKNASYLRLLAETEVGRKEFPHALEHAEQALKLLPGDKDASIVMSSALIGLKRHQEADRILAGLVERYPDSAKVQFHMADNLAAMERLEDSLKHFDILLQLKPEEADYRRARANVLYAMGHEAAAIAEWKALAGRTPPDQKSLINLGWAAWKVRDLEGAYGYAKRLIDLDGRNVTYLKFAGSVQLERGDAVDALRLAQQALDLIGKDKDAALLKAKALFNLYRDKEAMAAVMDLLREYPDNQQLVFTIADFLQAMERRQESLVFFNRLIKAHPDNLVYRYRRAELRYELGEFDEAVAEWKELADKYPAEVRALQKLSDDAISRNAWDEALLYFQEMAGRKPLDSGAWDQIANLYYNLKSYPQAVAAAEKAVQLNPADQGALFLKAETLEAMSDLKGAEDVYHELLQRNPNSLRTLSSLGRIAEQKGDYGRAIRLMQTMRKLSFSDSTSSPYLDILEARLWADSGKIEKGMRVLKKKATKRRISIPVLVFHGVSKYPRGAREAIPRAVFEQHMLAIKKAGYNPISVDQLAKYWDRRGSLPDKPILITFDDARADAFNNSDPVLADNGMKATMFVHLTGGSRRTRYYASGPLLKKWNQTGRWEVQAHSNRAHESLPIDAAGHTGHFLSNRRWLPEKKRLETTEEFAERLDGDFRGAKEKMEGMFPETKMHAYAFPFGDMGQTDFTNTPEAPVLNWQAVHRYYKFSFTQDAYGFNRVPTKITDLTRWTVKRDYTTRDVMKHLVMEEPWIKAKMLEADFWIRTNQPGRALSIYRELRKKQGVDEAQLHGGEALAFDMFGNGHQARKKWKQALERDPSKDKYRELAGFSAARDTPRLGTSIQRFSDVFTDNTKLTARFSQPAGPARIEPYVGKSFYGQEGQESITANEFGASMRWFPLPRVKFEGDATNRLFLEGQRRNSQSVNGQLTVPFFAPFRLGVTGGRNDVQTRQAIANGVFYRALGGLAIWDIAMNTTLQGSYELDSYSDGNKQRLISGLLTRRLGTLWMLGYNFRYGEADFRTQDYYSPGRMAQHTGSVTLNGRFGERDLRRNVQRGFGTLTGSLGYGTQDGQHRLIQGVRAGLNYRLFGDLSAGFNAGYTQSPLYISRTVGASLGLDF